MEGSLPPRSVLLRPNLSASSALNAAIGRLAANCGTADALAAWAGQAVRRTACGPGGVTASKAALPGPPQLPWGAGSRGWTITAYNGWRGRLIRLRRGLVDGPEPQIKGQQARSAGGRSPALGRSDRRPGRFASWGRISLVTDGAALAVALFSRTSYVGRNGCRLPGRSSSPLW